MERQDVYATCLEAAIAFGAEAAPRLVGRARELMAQRAPLAHTQADRASLIEAERFLSLRQDLFCAAYPDALRREFTSGRPQAETPAREFSFESLELMQEDQVDETVEVLRGQQAVLAAVESDLAVLNALISAAQGHRAVSAAANPFRPDAWVRALRSATMECRVPPAVRARWLHSLCDALGPELAGGYRLLCELLRRHGVAAASFVVNAPGATPARAPAPPGAAGARLATAAAGAAPLLNLHDLRRLLTGAADPAPAGAAAAAGTRAPADHPMTVPWAFEALQEIKGADDVLQRMQQRRASGRVAGPGQANAAAPTPAQALGQEVVRVMVENMTADQRLPGPVRQAIVDLQPLLLRVVRGDPRFFRDKAHPARRLLSEITERSLAWPSPDRPGFGAFFQPVREAVDALVELNANSAEPFEVALDSLDQAWAQEEARVRQRRARAAQALIEAEKRNMIALRIADELKRRPDVAAAPLQIRRFVEGPWSQVIAAARMRDSGSRDAQGYGEMINDLIWTTQPRLAGENRARLARLAPQVVASLRAGLASIEYPPAETQWLLDYVAGLHQIALGAEPVAPARLSREELDTQIDQASRETWLRPQEARDSGLMEWEPLPGRTEPGRPGAGGASGALALDALRTGVWVDLLLDDAWSRWRLAWAGSHSLLFMFTDGAGGSRSVTRTTLARMIADGAVRLVADQPVLSGALDAVASRALRNTLDTTL